MPSNKSVAEQKPPVVEAKFIDNGLYAATDLSPFQKLVGGIPIGANTAFFGPPEAGKSSLAAQLSAEFAIGKDANFVVHDTELNRHTYLPVAEKLSKRFDTPIRVVRVRPSVTKKKKAQSDDDLYTVDFKFLTPEPKDGTKLYLMECPDAEVISHLYGHGFKIIVSEGGRVAVDLLMGSWSELPEDIPLHKFMVKNNCKSLVIDSITNPMDEIPGHTKNFPGRSDANQIILNQVAKIAWDLDIPVFSVHHETRNNAGFSQDLEMEGGKAVLYGAKYKLYLLPKNEKGLLPGDAPRPTKVLSKTGRYLFGARIPGKISWSESVNLDMTEKGFDAYVD